MKRFDKRRSAIAAINITPLVDVLLILVAALLLLAPQFVKPLPVQLPKTSLDGAPTAQQSLTISLANDGTLLIDGAATPLREALGMVEPEITTVQIAADGSVPYDEVVRLIASVRSSNPREILLLTR
jgi:biopolymer transport protein TolR